MTMTDPPATFEYYEREVNPYALLGLLRDHGMSKSRDVRETWNGQAETDPDPDTQAHALRELAMSAVVVQWWSRWMPSMVHRALLNGADLADVAEAMGRPADEVFEAWLPWVEGQVSLWRHTRPTEVRPLGVSPEQRDQVLRLFDGM